MKTLKLVNILLSIQLLFINTTIKVVTSSQVPTVLEYQRTVDQEKTPGNGGEETPSTSERYKIGYVDETGFLIIKTEEGFASEPYDIGDGTRTTGYGVTEKYQLEAFNSLLPTCTEQQASEVLGDLLYTNFTKKVFDIMKADNIDFDIDLNQHQFNAFCSLAYNIGIGGFQESTLYEMFLNGDTIDNIANRWLTYAITNANTGEEMQGLKDRRKRESDIFRGINPTLKPLVNYTNSTVITDNNGKGHIPVEYNY